MNDWVELPYRHFLFRHHPRSTAERDVERLGSAIDIFHESLLELFGLEHDECLPIRVRLCETVADRDEPPLDDEILVDYRSEAPGRWIEREIAAMVLADATGRAEIPDGLIDGVTGFVEERTGELDRGEVESILYEAREDGRSISPRRFLRPLSTLRPQRLRLPALASFVRHLVETYGIESLLRLVATLDPARLEESFREVYPVSFADAERAWERALEGAAVTHGLLAFSRRVLGLLRPHASWWAAVLFVMLLQIGYTLSVPFLLRQIFDHALPLEDRDHLRAMLAFIAVGFLTHGAAGLYQDYRSARLGTRILNDLRARMFAQIQALSLNYFSRHRTGDLVSRFGGDMAALESALTKGVPALVSSILVIGLTVVCLFGVDAPLAAITLAGIPLVVLGPRLLSTRAARSSYARKKVEGLVTEFVEESIDAQAVVKAFDLGERDRRRFDRALGQLAGVSRRTAFLSSAVGRLTVLGVLFVQLAVIGIGSSFVLEGRMTVGDLVAFVGLLLGAGMAAAGLGERLPVLLQAVGGMRRIDELLAEKPHVEERVDAADLPPIRTGIRFSNVVFSYTSIDIHLDHIDLSIPSGTTAAFVGPTGSGKSTTLSLILRFYDPVRGSVTIDGVDLRRVTKRSLRAQIGFVHQETFLFHDTIRENIRVGLEGATDEDVEAAARGVEIHEAILRMRDGYDTVVGERGSRISPGERQRIAIARALLRDPAILLLDEATSALDPSTEHAIVQTVERIAKERTVLWVTHRLATVSGADHLFVFDGGRIVERGRHVDLLREGGLYRRLWEQQTGFIVESGGRDAAVSAARLARLPILSGVDPEHLAGLSEAFVSETFEAEATIFEEGDPGERFYIVVRGSVEVVAAGASGVDRRLAVLEDGDVFGEIALVEDCPRTATVRTLAPTLVLSVGREPFLEALTDAPSLREAVEERIRSRLADTELATARLADVSADVSDDVSDDVSGGEGDESDESDAVALDAGSAGGESG